MWTWPAQNNMSLMDFARRFYRIEKFFPWLRTPEFRRVFFPLEFHLKWVSERADRNGRHNYEQKAVRIKFPLNQFSFRCSNRFQSRHLPETMNVSSLEIFEWNVDRIKSKRFIIRQFTLAVIFFPFGHPFWPLNRPDRNVMKNSDRLMTQMSPCVTVDAGRCWCVRRASDYSERGYLLKDDKCARSIRSKVVPLLLRTYSRKL